MSQAWFTYNVNISTHLPLHTTFFQIFCLLTYNEQNITIIFYISIQYKILYPTPLLYINVIYTRFSCHPPFIWNFSTNICIHFNYLNTSPLGRSTKLCVTTRSIIPKFSHSPSTIYLKPSKYRSEFKLTPFP